jgi:tetratricopeptide (TPR) repeat protein
MAEVVRSSDPDGRITFLASPNASMAVGYFGRFRTLASLYWENIAGVEAAAKIFSATKESEAREMILARGVTHVAVTSDDNFLNEYLSIARLGKSSDDVKETFGYQLLTGQIAPRWLRPLPFKPRFPVQRADNRALVFQVVPDQTEMEAAWDRGIADAARGSASDAAADFSRAISLAAPERRASLFESAGLSVYRWGEHQLAIQLLASANALRPSTRVAANIAWILATSANDSVRNGAAALVRADALARTNPTDLMVLDVLGAALADNQRFAEAVAVAQRMDSLARATGDQAGIKRAATRRATYVSGRPWRQ